MAIFSVFGCYVISSDTMPHYWQFGIPLTSKSVTLNDAECCGFLNQLCENTDAHILSVAEI